MNMCDPELPVFAVRNKGAAVEDSLRPPLVPSEKNNAVLNTANRKPRTREIASRYKSGISSTQVSTPVPTRRSASPNTGRSLPSPAEALPKRAQSAERRRPSTPVPRNSAPSSPSARPSTPVSSSKKPANPARDSITEKSNYSHPFSGRARDGLWPSTTSVRSLSSSFQSESIPIHVSKEAVAAKSSPDHVFKSSANVGNERKRTPLRGRNASERSENSRPVDNSLSGTKDQNKGCSVMSLRISTNALSKSMDLTDKANKSTSLQHMSRGVSPRRSLLSDGLGKGHSVDFTDKASRAALFTSSTRTLSPGRMGASDNPGRARQKLSSDGADQLSSDGSERRGFDGRLHANVSSQLLDRTTEVTAPSRTRSLPISGLNRPSSPSRVPNTPTMGITSPSSPSRAPNTPTKSLSRPSSPSRAPNTPTKVLSRPSTPNRVLSAKNVGPNRPSSPSRSLTNPVVGPIRPSSPNRALSSLTTTTRGLVSPLRTRPSTPFSYSVSTTSKGGGTSSVFNYIAEVRQGKKSANHLEDSHQLRLLYNRDLQWRFLNAKSDFVSFNQKVTAESTLNAVWNTTSQLRDAVTLRRLKLQMLKQEMKLNMILNGQVTYLEEWDSLEREHCDSLSGATESLKASILRLPITSGARADVYAVKCAISSAVDVMQAVGSLVCHLLSKVEGIKCFAAELSVLAAKEKSMLDECRELLALVAASQVQESSLRTHLLQLRQDATKLN